MYLILVKKQQVGDLLILGRPLSTICRKLFEKYNFCSTFSIEETVLTNFLTKVETAYKVFISLKFRVNSIIAFIMPLM